MKKVINPTPENIITLQEVINSDAPIVGFQLKNLRVTLIPEKYRSSLYYARCVIGWERGNDYNPSGVSCQTIAEWEKFFRVSHKAEMLVFDSPKELFLWLAEGCE
jgi:hypothetical protein